VYFLLPSLNNTVNNVDYVSERCLIVRLSITCLCCAKMAEGVTETPHCLVTLVFSEPNGIPKCQHLVLFPV